MTIIYVTAIAAVAYFSLRSIAKSLKKGATTYEYSKDEMKANGIWDDYSFESRK